MDQARGSSKIRAAGIWFLAAGYLIVAIFWSLAQRFWLPVLFPDPKTLAVADFVSVLLLALLSAALIFGAAIYFERRGTEGSGAGRPLPPEFLMKAVEAMQLGLTVVDVNGRIVYCNPSDAAMHGYDPQELIGQDVQILAPEERRHRLTYEDLKRMKRWRRESVNIRKDGSSFPVQLLSDTVLDAQGQPWGVITTCEDITERRQLEQQLKESEEHYRLVVEGAAEMIICLDNEGRIVYANRAWAEAMGYTLQETMRLDFLALLDEDSQKHCQQAMIKVLQGTPWQNLQLGLITSDGRRIPVEGSLTMYRRQGRIVGSLGIFRDITYRKQIDEVLRRNEKQFRLLIKNALDIIMIINRDGTIRYASPSVHHIFGFKPEELLGQPLSAIVEPDEISQMEQRLQQMRRGELTTAAFEFKGRPRQGGWRMIEVMANNLLDEPSVEGVVINARDVTEQSLARERLASSEERFRYLADSAADAIITIDQQGTITFWNQAAEAIFGYPAEEALRERIELIIPKRYLSRSFGRLDQIFSKTVTGSGNRPGERPGSRPVEMMARRRGGAEFPAEISYAVWSTREGSFLTAIIRDISERKEAEKQLKYLSFHDPLTGLYNRAYFEEEMSRIGKSRYKTLGLILADVDGLKLINDTLGHKTGDGLLLVMAGIIKDSCRLGDLVARIGGDEFAVMLPNCDRTIVEGICGRIRETTQQYNQQNPELPLSLSVGHAIRAMGEAAPDDVFREADGNMYREKVRNHDRLVQGFIQALEQKRLVDPQRTLDLEELMLELATAAGVPHHQLADISLLAKYHDIGMALLAGPEAGRGVKTEEDRRHAEIGYHIAVSTPCLSSIAEGILKHHEQWDGQGYPLGLAGEDVPLEVRILMVASAFLDLLGPEERTSPPAVEKALALLKQQAGQRLDPQLTETLAKVVRSRPSPGR